MERLTESNPTWIDDEFWVAAEEPDDEIIDAVYRKLKAYEDAEEQGLLVRLPCKRGDAITATVLRPFNGHSSEIQGEVSDVQIVVRVRYGADRYINFLADDFGKTVFLTREEAEAALRKRKGGGEDA